jgi:hypothetical protein
METDSDDDDFGDLLDEVDDDETFITNTEPDSVRFWTEIARRAGVAITIKEAYDRKGKPIPRLVAIHAPEFVDKGYLRSELWRQHEIVSKEKEQGRWGFSAPLDAAPVAVTDVASIKSPIGELGDRKLTLEG